MTTHSPEDGEHLSNPEASPAEIKAIYEELKRVAIEHGELMPLDEHFEITPEFTGEPYELILELAKEQARSVFSEDDEDLTSNFLSWSESYLQDGKIVDPMAVLTLSGEKYEGGEVVAGVIYDFSFVEKDDRVTAQSKKLTMPTGRKQVSADDATDESLGEMLHQRMAELMKPTAALSKTDAAKLRQILMME